MLTGANMKTIVITGLSGAGKSEAIQILEDQGYFCVDNLPPKLIEKFVDLVLTSGVKIDKFALVTDIRSEIFNQEMQNALIGYQKENRDIEVIFLEADKQTLISRYKQTRRRHPLIEVAGNLESAIELECKKMEPFRKNADLIINTSQKNTKQLKKVLHDFLQIRHEPIKTIITVTSFGFKYGIARTADFVFDVRFLPNPYYVNALKNKTGCNTDVRNYVMQFQESQNFLNRVVDLIEPLIPQYEEIGKNHLEIAFGCTGGQHRSVTFAVLFEEAFKQKGYQTTVYHRDIERDRLAE